jgi:hypothetical protein
MSFLLITPPLVPYYLQKYLGFTFAGFFDKIGNTDRCEKIYLTVRE